MTIQINEDFRVSTDDYNFILERRQIIQKSKNAENVGKEQWVTIGFYGELSTLFASMIQRPQMFHNTEIKTFTELRTALLTMTDVILKAIPKMPPLKKNLPMFRRSPKHSKASAEKTEEADV